MSSTNVSVEEQAAPILNAPGAPLIWKAVIELGYSLGRTSGVVDGTRPPLVCFGCGRSDDLAPFSRCARCKVAAYCQKECQVADWKASHKLACASYARVALLQKEQQSYDDLPVGATQAMKSTRTSDRTACAEARNEIFARIRFYACPYAVTKQNSLGKGFLFIQSDQTLVVQSLGLPKDINGQSTGMRSIMVHFLTLGEYDQEVCRDDFEMTAVRSVLQDAVARYEETSEVVVLMRFRCGHVALGTATLVPEYNVCKVLGRDYFASSSSGALQLNLDDL